MKKLLLLTFVFGAIISTAAYAQPAGDPPSVLQQMKDQQKGPMVEKTGLTEAQVEKIIEINYDIRMQAGRELKDLNEADRSKKLAEFKALKEKRYSEIPLTAEQIKTVYAYYEEMGKNSQRRIQN